jgi:hypothetical protein
MKMLIYAAVIMGLVPLQSVLLPHVSLWGVKPDLGLVTVCLIGLFEGELDGLLFGVALGWAMSLFSAQDLVSGAIMKGAMGYLAGLAGRQLVYLTPVVLVMGLLIVSGLAGLISPLALKLSAQQDWWWAVTTVVLPQACLDAVIGGVVYWVMWTHLNIERWVSESRM